MPIQTLYIGEIARRSGATIKAIRHYEALGLLSNIQRNGTYRTYSEQHVAQIKLIKCAQQLGFTLKELHNVVKYDDGLDYPWDRIEFIIHNKIHALDKKIAEAKEQQQLLRDFEAAITKERVICDTTS